MEQVRPSTPAAPSAPPNPLYTPGPLLPPSYTLFVGRIRELGEIQDALASSRIVTLTGPGGCGKTRIALEYVRRLSTTRSTFGDGFAWCDLAAITDPSYVPARLAAALALTERPEVTTTDLIVEALVSQERLLILDNCEHLVSACAALVETILAQCPRITVLATSIQPLGLAQERIYNLPPLAVPLLPAVPDDDNVAALGRTDAVSLFVHRGRDVFPGFTLNPENAAAVVTICRRLDGLPLAIELAAARVKMLAPAQIAARLDDAFGLLTRGHPDALPKHQTLRAILDWSFGLLTLPEQILLRRLSVFAGSFDVAMVEEICAQDIEQLPLDALTDLVDKSFVSILRHEADAVRYGLLETVRHYASEELDRAGERETLATRHLEWFTNFAERHEPDLKGASQTAAYARLQTEYDNLLAALQFAYDTARTESGLRLAVGLGRFWRIRGHLSEARLWLKQLLAIGQDPADREAMRIRAGALFAAGVFAYHQSEYDDADACLRHCLYLRQALEDRPGIAVVSNSLGNVALDRGNPVLAIELFQVSLQLRRELGEPRSIAIILNNLGNAASYQGEYERAAALYQESLALYRQLGDQWSISSSLNNLAEMARRQGDWSRAENIVRESLAMHRALGEQSGEADALWVFAGLAFAQHDRTRARTLYKESLALYQSVNNKKGMTECLAGLAALEQAQGRAERAACLWGMTEVLRERLHAPLSPNDRAEYERAVARLREHLDERVFVIAWTQGRALPFADAIAYALSEPAHVSPESVELYISAFGTTTVQHDGLALADTDWKYAKARELLFFLLTRSSANKEELGLALWPDVSATQLRDRLHRVLYHARKALGKNDWIQFENDEYVFNRMGSYWFDVEQFEQRWHAAQEALAATPPQTAVAIRLLQDATPLYTGDFLSEMDAEWIIYRREELRQQALDALLQLGHLLSGETRCAEAIEVYQRVLALDNYLEIAHRELMRCFARLGEPGRALRHLEQLRRVLRDELGAEPSPETLGLGERIRSGDAT